MIFIILFLGLVLRLISLNQSLWLDEATSALVAQMSFSDIFTKFLPGDFHPPLYYLVLKLWTAIFGYSEISLRIPSVIFGVLTVYLVYKISKSKLATLLTVTSGLLIYYSQEARMYMLVAFLVAWSIYLYQEKKWLLFSIVLALIGMTDYLGLLILPIFGIMSLKLYLPLIFTYLIWSPVFFRQLIAGLSVEGSNWWNILGTPTIKNILLIPTKFMIGRISFENNYVYGVVVILVSAFVVFILSKVKLEKNLLYWKWLFVPVILGIILSLKIPVLHYFRFIFCLPALYILISQSKAKMVFIYFVLLTNMLFTTYYILSTRFHREDWRGVVKEIGNNQIILPSDSQKEALIYYGKADQIVKTPTEKTVWLSRYVWEIFDPADLTRLNLEKLGYNKAEEHNFNGVVFYKYENRN